MQSARLPIAILIALACCGCATKPMSVWDGDAIARSPAAYLNLKSGSAQEIVGTVRTERIRRIADVKQRIEGVANQSSQFLISDGKEPNAFSTKVNGVAKIGINLGMIELMQDDEDAYAAIIGHEVAHLALDHQSARGQREDARSAASSVLGILLGVAGVPMGGTLASLGTTAISRVYSRDEERDADRLGFSYMAKAGFDPQGAIRVWEKLSKTPSSASLPFMNSHPASEERIENMKRFAAEGAAGSN
jgi:predicted Zn-dependent protease